MKLTFIGSGSAFTVGENYQSNMILTNEEGKHLLLDCGSDARFALNELGFSYLDIQEIYISHLHADHVGGLEWMAFTTKFDPRCSKPRIYAGKDLLPKLWSNILKGGLSSLEGVDAELETYFDVVPVPPEASFFWGGTEFQLVRTIHVISGNTPMPSYGLFFSCQGKKIFISTDTKFDPENLTPFYEKADIIFHDCETSPHKSGVHPHYSELKTLPEVYRRKMWLYHYQPGPLPDAVYDSFRGFVSKGQQFDLSSSATFE